MSKKIILDVRTTKEFNAEHIKGSIDIPLSFIETREDGVAKLLEDKEVLIICRSGRRADLAKRILKPHLEIEKLKVYKWGLEKYKIEHPEDIIQGNVWFSFPIMRQVQIVAWGLVVLFSILGFIVHPSFFFGGLFVWAGLMFAGISGFCGMATLIAKLPFNR